MQLLQLGPGVPFLLFLAPPTIGAAVLLQLLDPILDVLQFALQVAGQPVVPLAEGTLQLPPQVLRNATEVLQLGPGPPGRLQHALPAVELPLQLVDPPLQLLDPLLQLGRVAELPLLDGPVQGALHILQLAVHPLDLLAELLAVPPPPAGGARGTSGARPPPGARAARG